MGTEAYEVMMATFPNMDEADATVEILQEMAKAGTIEIIDAAVLKRDEDGKTSVEQVSLPSPGGWGAKGAIIGGIVGVIFPPSLLAGAVVGAGIGAGSAAIAKAALKSPELEEAAESLEPGTSAFIAVIDAKWARQFNEAMKGYNKLAEHALDADSAAHLGIIADQDTGDAAMSATAFGTDAETGVVTAESLQAAVDGATGTTVASGAAIAADPETGDVAAAVFGAVVVPDEEGSDDTPAVEADNDSDDEG